MKHEDGKTTRRRFLGTVGAGAAGLVLARNARAAGEPLFSFGALTDIQYCDHEPAGARFYRNSVAKAQGCVDFMNTQDLAFAIHLGDFIDRDFASFDDVLPIYGQLEAPRYHVLGNHDFAVAPQEKDKVPGKLGMPGRYYDFIEQNWRFIVLDGNDVSLYARPEGSAEWKAAQTRLAELEKTKAPNAQNWNGAFGEAQLAWLGKTLKDAAAKGQRVVLFCHFPVCPPNAHNLWNDAKVMDLIDSHPCVAAYINGHNHAGNYAERKGVHYLTLHGMVDTPDSPAYAVVEVYEDRLVVDGFGREPDRILTLRASS